jgi:hypothetical protein
MGRRGLVLISVALLLLTPVTYAQDEQEETGLEEFDQAMTDLLLDGRLNRRTMFPADRWR